MQEVRAIIWNCLVIHSSKQKDATLMQMKWSCWNCLPQVLRELNIYIDSNDNKIMITKIKENKSIKTCGNCALILFSNSSKMYLNIISSKYLLQFSEKSFRRPEISENFPHCLHFPTAKHPLVQVWYWCWSLTLVLLS